jgi:glycerol-3-phosphate acyltransferase PlsX
MTMGGKANGPAYYRIALDVMGGDHGPRVTLAGAAMALGAIDDLYLLLVGNQGEIEPRLAEAGIVGELCGRTKVVNADSVVSMEDKATCVLKEKKNSSIRVAAECVARGEAHGVVSMGHTGAAMVASVVVIGTLPGVHRPCLATVLPSLSGKPTVLLDVGANVDCNAEQIAQFALMGAVYAEDVLGAKEPRVGILSVGEEDSKGSETTKSAAQLLRAQDINFVGNAEGRDVWHGGFDVIACDGFVGNVVLKTSEALAEGIIQGLKDSIMSGPVSRLGGLLVRPAMRKLYKKLDYAEYGGAPLLGVKGISIIGHGRSDARAVAAGVRAGVRAAKNDISGRIQERTLRAPRIDCKAEGA